MATGPDTYKNLTYVIPEPLTGAGGQALNNNFKYIADRLEALNNNQLTKISPATLGNLVKLKADGSLEDTGIPSTRLDDVVNIPTDVDAAKTSYHLVNQGDGTINWEAPTTGTAVSATVSSSTTHVDVIDDLNANSATWNYVLRNTGADGNLRAGTITAVWEESDPDSAVKFFEYATNDIGTTTAVTFDVIKNDTADTIALLMTATSGTWEVKAIRTLLEF